MQSRLINENILEQLKKVHDPEVKFYKCEIQNFIITIFDNYIASIKYLENYESLIDKILTHQKDLYNKVDHIKNTIDNNFDFSAKQKNKMTKFYTNYDKIVISIFKIKDITDFVTKNYLKGEEKDQDTFAEFIFEVYYKNQIKYIKGLSPEFMGDSNMLLLLNDHFNNITSRKVNFMTQLVSNIV